MVQQFSGNCVLVRLHELGARNAFFGHFVLVCAGVFQDPLFRFVAGTLQSGHEAKNSRGERRVHDGGTHVFSLFF